MERPNLKRIAKVFGYYIDEELIDFKSETFEEWNPDINEIAFTSKMISEGRISYPVNPSIEDLIKKYKLEAMLPDFSLMGLYFAKWKDFDQDVNKIAVKRKGLNIELLQTLKLLYDYKNGLSFNIIRKQKVHASIQNSILIEAISQSLFEFFKEHDFNLSTGNPWPKDIQDWGEYFDSRINEQKIQTSKKGRKRGNYSVKKIIFYLWKYLQEYTEFKAEAGAGYSQEQARFIFCFLEISGLIENPKLITNQEDFIGYHLKDYRKLKMKLVSGNENS
jgi:hypothetical protein